MIRYIKCKFCDWKKPTYWTKKTEITCSVCDGEEPAVKTCGHCNGHGVTRGLVSPTKVYSMLRDHCESAHGIVSDVHGQDFSLDGQRLDPDEAARDESSYRHFQNHPAIKAHELRGAAKVYSKQCFRADCFCHLCIDDTSERSENGL